MPYCTICGKVHDITTAAQCPYYPINYYPTQVDAPYTPYTPTTIESKLDRIIELLERILTLTGGR